MDYYTLVSILTLIGFAALAAILLVPVYRFLKREEQISQQWTPEQLAKRVQEQAPGSNGADERAPEEKPSR